jgi:hypothetical protein
MPPISGRKDNQRKTQAEFAICFMPLFLFWTLKIENISSLPKEKIDTFSTVYSTKHPKIYASSCPRLLQIEIPPTSCLRVSHRDLQKENFGSYCMLTIKSISLSMT